MKRLLAIIFLTLITLFFALATTYTPITRLFYVMALVLVGGLFWSWRNLKGISVSIERRTHRLHVGQAIDERITITNSSRFPKPWLEVVELTDIPGHHTGLTVALPSRGFRSWRTTTEARRRGVYTLGPLRVASGDPFGLFRFERFYAEKEQVVILPRVVPLPRFVVSSSDLPGEGHLRRRSHEVSPHASSIREYVPGDSLNRIHWPSTMRQSSLMVKEFDLGLTTDAWVLLDLDADAQTLRGDDGTEELAVTAAASISHYFSQRGLSVGFAINTPEFPVLPPERGRMHDARILDTLATVHATAASPLSEAIPKLDQLASRNTSVVIVTPASSSSWVGEVGGLVHRGVKVAAILIDGATYGGEVSPRGLVPALRALGVTSYVIGKDDAIATALDRPVAPLWGEREGRQRRGSVAQGAGT